MTATWSTHLEEKAYQVLVRLQQDERLGRYVNQSLHIPKPYRGQEDIRLIVLGQDPTTDDAEGHKDVRTVLNLDTNGSARAYLSRVCNALGLRLTENIYATNVYKNFFVDKPTRIKSINIYQAFADDWYPLLLEELAEFGNIPVITLGNPILAPLVNPGTVADMKHYWGYVKDWKNQTARPFRYILPDENRLQRIVFPFPHAQTRNMQFYQNRMDDYLVYVRRTAFP